VLSAQASLKFGDELPTCNAVGGETLLEEILLSSAVVLG